MAFPVLSLRLRVFLFFALLALAPPLLAAMAIVLAHTAPDAERLRLLGTYAVVAAILCSLLTLLVWQLFDRYVASALQSLARQMQTALHSQSPQLLDEEQWCYLGPVGDASMELVEEIRRLRTAADESPSSSADQPAAEHLANIIQDLETGVLVMNLGFDILLYNRHALHLLSGLAPDCVHALGLGRSATDLIPRATLEQLASEVQLQADLNANGLIGAIPLQVCTPDGRQTIQARMHLARRASGESNGYVMILDAHPGAASSDAALPYRDEQTSDPAAHQDAGADRVSSAPGPSSGALLSVNRAPDADSRPAATGIVLPERPEFYDFDLYERRLPSRLSDAELATLDYVVFDTETTGLEPSSGDEIIQIAAVRIVNGRLLQGEYFDQLVNPGRDIPAGSTTIHGISNEQVQDKPGIEEVLPGFARFVGHSILVAHNAAFDMRFLELKSDVCGVRFDNPVLDTVLLSAWLHDHSQHHTLDDLAQRYGIIIESRHSALGDSMATAQVFLRLLKQLASRDVLTLSEAITVSERMTHIRRAQSAY